MMEEEEGNGGATPALEPRRHELLAAAVGEYNTPAAAVSTHMNFEGSREFFFEPPPPPSDGGARSSAGECAAAAAINLLTKWNPQSQQPSKRLDCGGKLWVRFQMGAPIC